MSWCQLYRGRCDARGCTAVVDFEEDCLDIASPKPLPPAWRLRSVCGGDTKLYCPDHRKVRLKHKDVKADGYCFACGNKVRK